MSVARWPPGHKKGCMQRQLGMFILQRMSPVSKTQDQNQHRKPEDRAGGESDNDARTVREAPHARLDLGLALAVRCGAIVVMTTEPPKDDLRVN